MTAPAAPGTCGQRHPSIAGTWCTRARDHKGGHRDEASDRYWQAGREPAGSTESTDEH